VKKHIVFFLYRFLKDQVELISDLQKQYGDIFRKKFHGVEHHFICHPTYAEYVLATHAENFRKHPLFINTLAPLLGPHNLFSVIDPEMWKVDRGATNTAFEADVYFERYAQAIVKNNLKAMDQWREKYSSQGKIIPIRHELEMMTLGTITSTILHHSPVDPDDVTDKMPEMFVRLVQKATTLTFIPWIFPSIRKKRFNDLTRFFAEAKKREINSRIEGKKDYDDVIGTLMSVRKVTDSGCPYFDDVSNHLLTFTILGYTTISSILLSTIASLVQHPEIERRISEEVSQVCNGRIPTYADFDKLVYTKATVWEISRLNTPFPIVPRQVVADDEINGYSVFGGDCVMLSAHMINRCPEYWDKPSEMIPERFISKPYGQDYPYAFLSFGGGKRSCVAKNFVLLDVTLTLAMIVQRFQFEYLKNFELKREYLASIFLFNNLKNLIIRDKP
jgi:cytochrome P450